MLRAKDGERQFIRCAGSNRQISVGVVHPPTSLDFRRVVCRHGLVIEKRRGLIKGRPIIVQENTESRCIRRRIAHQNPCDFRIRRIRGRVDACHIGVGRT